MLKQKKMIGVVTWPPNHQACYVRVNIPNWETGILLSIKATFTDFDRRNIEKGDMVEVERSDPRDARRFRVLRLMKEVKKKPVNSNIEVTVLYVDKHEENQKMDNRVRFFIRDKYLQNLAIYSVMRQAFGLVDSVTRELHRKKPNGFWIICREDQFARFMIYRNDAGIQNGFIDLKTTLIPAYGDVYERLAHLVGMTHDQTKKVALALQYDRSMIEERLEMRTGEVDVSGNC